MNFNKDRKMRSVSVFHILIADPSTLAMEYTKLALVVALVLVPTGLVGLATMNLTGIPENQVLILQSVAVLIIVGILFAVLGSAMKTGKTGKHK